MHREGFSGGDRPFFLRHEAGSFERVFLDAKSFELKSHLEKKGKIKEKGGAKESLDQGGVLRIYDLAMRISYST